MQFAFAGNFNFKTTHFRLKQWGKLNNRLKKKVNDAKISNTKQFKHSLFNL